MSSQEKPRFELLDGVRGVAAIVVMLYHFTQHNSLHWMSGAWAAVDLFFVLSGFVILHSYGGKIAQGMPFWAFVKSRLIRLGPLYYLGLILGFAAALILIVSKHDSRLTWPHVVQAFGLGLAWLPYRNYLTWPIGSSATESSVFPLDEPAWSLFFEVLVNIVFFWVIRYFKDWFNWKTVAALYVVFGFCVFRLHHVHSGWGTGNFIFGFPRVTAEFFLGALIYQSGLYLKLKSIPFAILASCGVFLLFFSNDWRLSILDSWVLVPLCLALLAGLPAKGVLALGCRRLGELSYPIYILHFPIYRLIDELFDVQALGEVSQTLLTAAIVIALADLFARGDVRLRGYLNKRFA